MYLSIVNINILCSCVLFRCIIFNRVMFFLYSVPYKLIIYIDRPTTHSLPLARMTNPFSEGKVGRFCRLEKTCIVNVLFLYLIIKKSLNLSLFMNFVLYRVNKQRQIYRNSSTPFPRTTLYICACATCREPKKVSKGFNFRENDRALYYSELCVHLPDPTDSAALTTPLPTACVPFTTPDPTACRTKQKNIYIIFCAGERKKKNAISGAELVSPHQYFPW